MLSSRKTMIHHNNFDMYRRVKSDFMEDSTTRSKLFSMLALSLIILLFVCETMAFFFDSKIVADIRLDNNQVQQQKEEEDKIRVGFNITMMDLRCEYVDWKVVTQQNKQKMIISKEEESSVHLRAISAEGVRKRFHQGTKKSKGEEQHDLQNLEEIELHDSTIKETIEELHLDGEDAISLSPMEFQRVLETHEYVFLDFYAMWCSHCQILMPTWEKFAEVLKMAELSTNNKEDLNEIAKEVDGFHDIHKQDIYSASEAVLKEKKKGQILIAKIDCVKHVDFCRSHFIRGYPTLRLFHNGRYQSDYMGDRTIKAMSHFLAENEEVSNNNYNKRSRRKKEWVDSDHPGCEISGSYLTHRGIPATLIIEAKSDRYDLIPHMTNMSHEVHTFQFGSPFLINALESGIGDAYVPNDFYERIITMDRNVYVHRQDEESERLHHNQAFHHHLQVIPSEFDFPSSYAAVFAKHGFRDKQAYQILLQTSHVHYDEARGNNKPQVKFHYEISPVKIHYKNHTRHFYEWLTSVLALVGGCFVSIELIERVVGILYETNKKKHRRR